MDKFDELQRQLRDLEIEEEYLGHREKRAYPSRYDLPRKASPLAHPEKKRNSLSKAPVRERSRSAGLHQSGPSYEINHSQNEIMTHPQRQMLEEIFAFYQSQGDRLSSQGLGSFKVQKFMLDAGIYDENLDSVRVDLLFSSLARSKKFLDSSQFFELIIQTAGFKYPGASSPMALMFKDYVFPLLRNIRSNSNIPALKAILREPVDVCSTKVLFETHATLLRVYKVSTTNKPKFKVVKMDNRLDPLTFPIGIFSLGTQYSCTKFKGAQLPKSSKALRRVRDLSQPRNEGKPTLAF